MATDPALVGLHDPQDGKLDAAADMIVSIWRDDPTSLQLVFCDVGTPNAKKGAQTYGRLRRMLTDRGMPVGLIRFRHDAKTDGDVAQLFAECRVDGKVAVLMGSTDKMGVGTNVQRRVLAMHHLDAPWRPADVEQRDGRGVRPGNRYKLIRIYRYVVERTFDAYTWQLLARKIGFIAQIVSGNVERTIEDVSADTVDAYSAIKAVATGQPLLLEKGQVEADVKRLRAVQKGHRMMVDRLNRQISSRSNDNRTDLREAEAWEALAATTGPAETIADLDEDEAKRLHEYAKGFRRAWRYSEPERFAGVEVSLGEWHTLGSEPEAHPAIRVRGRTADGSPGEWLDLNAYQFWTPQNLARKFAVMLRSAFTAAAYRRDSIGRRERDNERDAESAARPFADADALAAAVARLGQIEVALQAAAMANPEDADPDSRSGSRPDGSEFDDPTRQVRIVHTQPAEPEGEPEVEAATEPEPGTEPAAEVEPDADSVEQPDAEEAAEGGLSSAVEALLGDLMDEYSAATRRVLADLMAG